MDGIQSIKDKLGNLCNCIPQVSAAFYEIAVGGFEVACVPRGSQLRRQNNEFIEIRSPRIAMLLSGTPNQVSPLLRNRENGLMSRFACYVVNSRMDFDDNVWDVEGEGNTPSEALLYDRLASE